MRGSIGTRDTGFGGSDDGTREQQHEAHEKQGADNRDTVKYHAYLRKATRFNPTRGGESISHNRLSHGHAILTVHRSLPLPRPVAYLLQGRPRHDSPQDRPRCRRP
jgi:hypothetical protein